MRKDEDGDNGFPVLFVFPLNLSSSSCLACASCVGKHWRTLLRQVALLHEPLKMPDCLGGQEHIGTYVAHVGGDVLKHKNVFSSLDGMYDQTAFICSRATLDATFHSLAPLLNGVGHFGGTGS